MSSPPSLPNPTNPLKRPSISSTTSQGGGANKRPRMHPLRQTSFPTSSAADTDSRAFSDAGSVSGSFTGSLGGASAATGEGVFAGTKLKKRGRKSKAEKEREREIDAASARGGTIDGRLGSVDADGSSVRAGGGGRGGGGGEDDEDDDLDDEGELFGEGDEGPIDTDAEKKNLAILVDAFNPIQSARYDLFKRAKLRKETLRRIVNHALSQSVPASVVTTINGFTKVFAGEIIEKARTVQAEWAEAHDQATLAQFEAEEAEAEARAAAAQAAAAEAARLSAPSALSEQKPTQPQPRPQQQPQQQPAAGEATPMTTGENGIVKKEPQEGNGTPVTPSIPPHISPANASTSMTSTAPSQSQTTAQYSPTNPPGSQSTVETSFNSQDQSVRPKREFKPPPNPHRGQLLPSHLREAWRRYKRDQEGGGVGTSGLSLGNQGIKGAFTWSIGSTGRRLFR